MAMIFNKKYCWYVLILLFISALTGCSDFLERAPSDLTDEEKVFTNFRNAESYLNNAYRELPNLLYDMSGTNGSLNLGSATDEAFYTWGFQKSPKDIVNGNWTPESFPLDWMWHRYYSCIRRCNLFIKNFDKIPAEIAGENVADKRQRLIGEAYGLRGFYHFVLYTMWANIPYVDSPELIDVNGSIRLPQLPLDELVKKIDADLTKAEKYLPAKHIDAEFGRINTAAIKAIRSRLYLYYASPLSNTDNDQTRWKKAAEVTKAAIDYAELNGYQLCTTSTSVKQAYERIFKEPDNSESIWAFYSPYNVGNFRNWSSWAGTFPTGGWAGEVPLQDLIDDYEMLNGEIPVLGYDVNGNQIVNPTSGYDPQNPYVNRDKRFYQTILYQGAKWKHTVIDVSKPKGRDYVSGFSNYYWKKYTQEDANLFAGSGFYPMPYIVFRLSELYLNYAEAANESLSVPDNSVYKSVNVIRHRAGLPELPTGLNKNEMRKRIQHERRIEFVMENQRFFDVRRWKIAEICNAGDVHGVQIENGKYSYSVLETRVFDKSKHYLFPIPQSEIDKNRGTLKQNPGW